MPIRDTDALVELLPCPFCGGAVHVETLPGVKNYPWGIHCPDGRCPIGGGFPVVAATKSEAITAWNTRASILPPTTSADPWEGNAAREGMIYAPPLPAGNGELVETRDYYEGVLDEREDEIEALTARVKELEEALTAVRSELPQLAMLIDSIKQEWEPGGHWSDWDAERRSAMTDLMVRIDALNPSPTEQEPTA